MKKLLLLLFIPFLGLAQMSGPTADDVADGEGAAGLVFLGTTEDANKALADVQVNDTIVMGIKLTNWLAGSTENPGNAITYAHIDLNWNKNAYTYIDATFKATDGNPQNSTFTQNGVKMSWNNNYQAYDIWSQWQNSSYASDTDWNNGHFQTQVTSGDLADLDHFVELKFKVHDAGANHDYTDNLIITMGKLVDNPNNKTYDPVYAYPKQDLSLEPKADIDVAGVSVKLVVGDNIDITKFDVVPLKKNTTEDNDGDGIPDDYWYTLIEGSTFWLDVPSNGTVDITEYLDDPEGTYAVAWEYDHDWNNAGTSTFKTDYEDILTVSDVQLALKYLVQHGEGGINSGVSLLNSDVAGSEFGGDGQLTDQDSYSLLAHVMGIDELYVDWNNDGTIDDTDANNQAGYFLRTFDQSVYEDTSADSYVTNGIDHGGSLYQIDIDFTDETSSQLFTTYATWKGDVNLSHSPDVSEANQNDALAKFNNSPQLLGKKIQSFGEYKTVAATVNGTILVEEQGDKVVAKITIPESNLTAAQIRLSFDDTRLTFDSVKTDSGNTATNFAKRTENRINFGSINMLDNKLTETIYTVTFSKKGALNGVTGLIILTNTDAADTNADRVDLNIQ